MRFNRFLHWKFRRKRCGAFLMLAIILSMIFMGIEFHKDWDDKNIFENHQKQHQLCVNIPYRERWDELQKMVPALHGFLADQGIVPEYIVVNQTDPFRFNRAALINIGSIEAEKIGCDYMAIHDVDLVPLNPNLNYRYPMENIVHLASGKYHPILRYDYKNFIGGVLIITVMDYKKVNGMSNDFWGWGLEDDDFYLRLRNAGMTNKILRPKDLRTDRTNTFLHLHSKKRKRDYSKKDYREKRKRISNYQSGLTNTNYTMQEPHLLKIGAIEVQVLNVNLRCDVVFTPYCLKQ